MQTRMVDMVESQERILLPAARVHLLRSKSVTGAQRVAMTSHFSFGTDSAIDGSGNAHNKQANPHSA